MTRSTAATETAIKRAIKANKATGGDHVIKITKSGSLLLIPAHLTDIDEATNDKELDFDGKIEL